MDAILLTNPTNKEQLIMSQPESFDVIVIGAGPSGAISSALLVQKGYSVLMLEREQFPRFSIGESLLPQCMAFIEEAGMLPAVQAGGFQFKNGAAFYHNGKHTHFDFTKKFYARAWHNFPSTARSL
jgi:2-polyprenyl-6-methoxyphenol hydroxylase-like FAD-dependent oxidoreductase